MDKMGENGKIDKVEKSKIDKDEKLKIGQIDKIENRTIESYLNFRAKNQHLNLVSLT